MERVLRVGGGAVAEVPTPSGHGADGFVLEGNEAARGVEDLERPAGIERRRE